MLKCLSVHSSRYVNFLNCTVLRNSFIDRGVSRIHTSHTRRTSATQSSDSSPSRSYPDEPRVGVGVVVLRDPVDGSGNETEVLIIKRGKAPSKGWWSLPGGGLELGETIVECAVREVEEETGVKLSTSTAYKPGGNSMLRQNLCTPVVFTAVDSIWKDDAEKIMFHYAIIEVAAIPEDPLQPLCAQADVEDAAWQPVSQLNNMPKMTPMVPEVAWEAVQRFAMSASPHECAPQA